MTEDAMVVAVIDSGWPNGVRHDRVRKGVGFDPGTDMPSNDCDDRIGHGLSCADLLLSTSPRAVVVPVRIFGDYLDTSIDVLCAGLSWAASSGVDLISLSVGTREPSHRRPLEKVVNRICCQGIPMVCAAGSHEDVMPAVFDGVIGVGGLRETWEPSVVIRRDTPVQAYARTCHPAVMRRIGRRAPQTGVSLSTAYVAGLIASLPRSVVSSGVGAILDALDASWGAGAAPGPIAGQRGPRRAPWTRDGAGQQRGAS